MEKKEKLSDCLQKLTAKREKTEESLQNLEERRRKAQEKAASVVVNHKSFFTDMRKEVDELEKKILNEDSKEAEKLSLSLSDAIQKLEIKKDDLSKKMKHIEELSKTSDPDVDDLCDPEEEDEGGDGDTLGHDGGDKGKEESDEDEQGQELMLLLVTIKNIIKGVNIIFYEQDPEEILLDVNTAADGLIISEDMKTVSRTEEMQDRPETPERFGDCQVMSSTSFSSGQHYWDVEISGPSWWKVGMCYPSVNRKGSKFHFGDNDKSWVLYAGGMFGKSLYTVMHNEEIITLPQMTSSDRVRVYVDYEAGLLSFYELCDPIRHIYTYTTTFTEPLHAAFCVWSGTVKILEKTAAPKEEDQPNACQAQ